MTKLTFPTLAEQAVQEFRSKTRTISLNKIARRMGAERERNWDHILWTFPDDTSIEVRGTGRNHSLTTHLP